jgi:hypothetical protein
MRGEMSASTIGRAIRALPLVRSAKRNKRSGANALMRSIPEMPGSQLPEDTPGTCQIDSVALCGGSMAESFFYLVTLTDAATQWFECAPSWNRSSQATSRAMAAIHGRLPFEITHIHPDNGSEFINRLFIRAMAALIPALQLSRSRPYHKNDNCRIEQKNGSIIRDYFSDIRFDRHSHRAALETLCCDIALYTNLFRPCKKLIYKQRKEEKGVKYVKRYDAPRTPLERLSEFLPHDDPKLLDYLRQPDSINSITLMKSIQNRLRALVREVTSKTPPQIRTISVSAHLTNALTM